MTALDSGSNRRGRPNRDARTKARSAAPTGPAYITREIPPYEMLGEEALRSIETHADRILQEVGMEIRGDGDALRLWRDAGADVDGPRIRAPAGLVRRIIQRSAPK